LLCKYVYLHYKEREGLFYCRTSIQSVSGEPLIIYRDLYGLKISSACFYEHFSAKLRTMDYRPTTAYNNFWIKEWGAYYDYIATYVDDFLVYSKDPMHIIEEL
jgi:hypothetical protein